MKIKTSLQPFFPSLKSPQPFVFENSLPQKTTFSYMSYIRLTAHSLIATLRLIDAPFFTCEKVKHRPFHSCLNLPTRPDKRSLTSSPLSHA